MGATTTVARVASTLLDVALAPLFLLSYVVPRTERVSVYGFSNGSSFTDNSKFQYLHACRAESDHRAVWLTREPDVAAELRSAGYEVHRFRSVAGVFLTLRAATIFVTHSRRDVPWWATGGARVVRLGHGIPFKKYGRADPGYRERKRGLKRLGYERTVGNYTATIATSETYARYVGAATALDPSSVHVTGLPRMDMPDVDDSERHLYCDGELVEQLADEHGDSQIVFYFPTWRDGDAGPVPDDLDFGRLDQILRETDSYLLVRPHLNTGNWSVDVADLDRVELLDGGYDFYPIFEYVDLFLTDYSSLFHDSVYYDVPVLFFAHDHSEYTARRAFFVDYRSVPGEIVTSTEELHDRLAAVLREPDAYADRYRDDMVEWRQTTFDHRDASNCERVARRFLSE